MSPTSPEEEHRRDHEERVSVSLARVEAKIDVILARHESRLDHAEARVLDHEDRLRFLEGRPVVQPRHVVGAVALVIPVLALIETAVIAAFMT